MRTIGRNVGQLSEAGQQLDKETPIGARLALLLVDNVAELLMYEKARLVLAQDTQFAAVIPPSYSSGKRKKVTRYFEEKVKFLVSETSDIRPDEADVLTVAHRLRNEAYHQGVLRESIVENIARTYFEVVCGLLPRLWLGGYGYSRLGEVEELLSTYGIRGSGIDRQVLAKICDQLLDGRRCPVPDLRESLSEDLLGRIEETLEGLAYLASGASQPTMAADVLRELQLHDALAAKYDFPNTMDGAQQYFRARRELEAEFAPPVTIDTFRQWKREASEIGRETTAGAVMRRFGDLESSLLPMETEVTEAVYQFDEWINLQVHDMRLG